MHGHFGGQDVNDQMNFCDHYFELRSLDVAVDRQASSPERMNRDILVNYYNRGTWSHRICDTSFVSEADDA
jgi:hypothetical protein